MKPARRQLGRQVVLWIHLKLHISKLPSNRLRQGIQTRQPETSNIVNQVDLNRLSIGLWRKDRKESWLQKKVESDFATKKNVKQDDIKLTRGFVQESYLEVDNIDVSATQGLALCIIWLNISALFMWATVSGAGLCRAPHDGSGAYSWFQFSVLSKDLNQSRNWQGSIVLRMSRTI